MGRRKPELTVKEDRPMDIGEEQPPIQVPDPVPHEAPAEPVPTPAPVPVEPEKPERVPA
jgi:hypothetical protein